MSTSRVGRNQEVDRSEREVPPRGPRAARGVRAVARRDSPGVRTDSRGVEPGRVGQARRRAPRSRADSLVKSRHLPVEGDNSADEDF